MFTMVCYMAGLVVVPICSADMMLRQACIKQCTAQFHAASTPARHCCAAQLQKPRSVAYVNSCHDVHTVAVMCCHVLGFAYRALLTAT